MPLDQRSVVPSIPGIPAWGAVAVAVGASVLGIVVDSFGGNELTATFAALYVVGCVAAVLLVRHRGLFTAMAQPPLIVFFGVPLAYQFLTTDAGTSVKDIVLNVAIPLVNRFPLMITATILVLLIGGARLLLDRKPQRPARSQKQGKSQKQATSPASARSQQPAKPTRRRAEAAPAASATSREPEEMPESSPWRRPRSEPTSPRGSRSAASDRRERDAEPPRRTRAQEAPRRADRSAPPGRTPRENPRETSRRGIYAPVDATREPSHLREPATSYEQERSRERPKYDSPNYDAPNYDAPSYERPSYERRAYEPRTPTRRAGAENPALTPHPAPRVRYRDRD